MLSTNDQNLLSGHTSLNLSPSEEEEEFFNEILWVQLSNISNLDGSKYIFKLLFFIDSLCHQNISSIIHKRFFNLLATLGFKLEHEFLGFQLLIISSFLLLCSMWFANTLFSCNSSIPDNVRRSVRWSVRWSVSTSLFRLN